MDAKCHPREHAQHRRPRLQVFYSAQERHGAASAKKCDSGRQSRTALTGSARAGSVFARGIVHDKHRIPRPSLEQPGQVSSKT